MLVLGNKIDKQGAIPEEDITAYFGLHQHLTGKVFSGRAGQQGESPFYPLKNLPAVLVVRKGLLSN